MRTEVTSFHSPLGAREEQQKRETATDRLNRFLDKIGFESSSEEKRMEWFKEIDFDTFMGMLFVMNGILTGQEKFQRWNGEIVKSVVSVGGLSTEDPDLEPPEHADQEFKKVFEQVQEHISSETKKASGAKLYTGILFAHMFHDGNGRLARNVYAMMTTGENPTKGITTTRGRATDEFAFVVSGAAYKSLIKKEGLDSENYSDYLAVKEGISLTDIDILKYIAARRVLEAQGKTVGNTIELTELDETTTEDFKKEYEKVRIEMFWETQHIVEDHADWATAQLDQVIRN